MPDIIVLIPHFNDIQGLNRSLNSISDQEPVDVLVVDDGSAVKPDQEELKKAYGKINDIIVLFSSPNKGQAFVQNLGLKYIIESNKYKLVARLDTGDTCVPERFVEQKQFFAKNPDVSLVGSNAVIADMDGKKLFDTKMPLTHKEIRKRMHAQSCFIHSSVMFRVDAIRKTGYYPVEYYANDDYAFWFKFIDQFITANMNKCLVTYELNFNSLSKGKYRKELRSRMRILLKYFSFKYLFHSILGLSKALAGYLIGARSAGRLVVIANKFKS